MSSAALALQGAIVAALSSHAELVEILGAPRIYDHVPQPPTYPYVALGLTSSRDADALTQAADEHVLTLHVWSRAAGRKEVYLLLDAIKHALHDAALPLTGHYLVNLRQVFSEARRDNETSLVHGLARFRAMTEPL